MPDVLERLLDDQQLAASFTTPTRRRTTYAHRYNPHSRRTNGSEDGRRLVQYVTPSLDTLAQGNAACYRGHIWNMGDPSPTLQMACRHCAAVSSARLAADRYARLRARRATYDRNELNHVRNTIARRLIAEDDRLGYSEAVATAINQIPNIDTARAWRINERAERARRLAENRRAIVEARNA